jgi:hypothetical protein
MLGKHVPAETHGAACEYEDCTLDAEVIFQDGNQKFCMGHAVVVALGAMPEEDRPGLVAESMDVPAWNRFKRAVAKSRW